MTSVERWTWQSPGIENACLKYPGHWYTPQEYHQKKLALLRTMSSQTLTQKTYSRRMILAWDLPLSHNIGKVNIGGKEVFKMAGNSLYACFDSSVDEAFEKAIAKVRPLSIVFRDASFKDDNAKSKVKQLLMPLSP